MVGIIGLMALLTVLGLSLIITRLATTALALTGLSRDVARFQARSAFTGTGFTTHEAETITRHPVRRRIVMLLMILRSAGLITIVISVILSFVGTTEHPEGLRRLGGLVGGVLLLWLLTHNRLTARVLDRAVARAMDRWTQLEVHDFASMLKLAGDYMVTELNVQKGSWLDGRRLRECRLHREGLAVLGIYRDDGGYVGAPTDEARLRKGDRLIVYGRAERIQELEKRSRGASGDQAHQSAVDDQQRHLARQEREERHRENPGVDAAGQQPDAGRRAE
ncbi:MAG: potassium transporter TrkA [Candidatus Eisenbacteria bacterium]|nr:potassium transporter TrkA [Candidatus Eisenbacteria bacterium]